MPDDRDDLIFTFHLSCHTAVVEISGYPTFSDTAKMNSQSEPHVVSTPFTTAPSSGHQTPYSHDDSENFTPPEGDIPEIPDTEADESSTSSAIHFSTGRRKMASDEPLRRAMSSFENLVALANSQETLRYVLANRRETWKGAKKMVWRDRGEPVVELSDGEECLKWAVKGGLRELHLYF